ncbi:MAG: iron ABC transporter permease [Prevotella sp.]|nr:iron ABC transporter permease [Candidatus Equicola stercoris]
MQRTSLLFVGLGFLLVIMFLLNLFCGAVHLSVGEVIDALTSADQNLSADRQVQSFIVLQTRLPQALTALLCGAALSASGLLLQTAFRNPLAGPDVFGINSGASLGVAIVMLFFSGSISAGTMVFTGFVAVLIAAFAGSMIVMIIILLLSRFVKNNVMLLIIGIMIGYIASSVISLLNYFSTDEGVQSYIIWGMGNFSGVSMSQMLIFTILIMIGIVGAIALIKPLNIMLLGEYYAENLEVKTLRTRNLLLIVTGILTAVVTAFCGPISFIGLAVPHIARLILKSDNHRSLLPMTLLCGSVIGLFCNLLCNIPGEHGLMPLNAVTPLIGAPIVIYVILKNK